jgi:flagellar hook-associated protein 1 FlgK
MAGIFDSLYTAYSGLQTSQIAVGVTSNNISNAQNPDYTRQRATIQAKSPFWTTPGDIGTGSEVVNVTRIHDEYVYKRLNSASTQKEFTDFEESTLVEVSKYFPDIAGNGVSTYIQSYFDAWQNYANNPSDSKLAIAVAEHSQNLSNIVKDTRDRVVQVQNSLNDKMEPLVDEVNRLAKEIADINLQISRHESNGTNKANTLRDERDKRETALAKLLNVTISKDGVASDMTVDPSVHDGTQQYVVQVGGYPLVDGATYHPIVLKTDANSSAKQFNGIFFEYQDYKQIDISEKITGGELGAIMDLRGTAIDETGMPTKGKLQEYIDRLDTFSKTFIENMNNAYASSSTDEMRSNKINSLGTEPLSFLPLNIKSGSFDVVAYDNSGNETARRTISVDVNVDTLNSLAAKINALQDDNKDGNANNDFSSFFNANFVPGSQGEFAITQTAAASGRGFKIAIEDSTSSPSNFAGALGLGRLFDGANGATMSLKGEFLNDPSLIHPYSKPVLGNNSIANKILQLQYDKIEFTMRDKSININTISGFYMDTATRVASDTETAVLNNDAATAVYNSVNDEMSSISKVSTDEEMVSLMKFQSGYQASAKVVTTLDQMLNTLLGIKQ